MNYYALNWKNKTNNKTNPKCLLMQNLSELLSDNFWWRQNKLKLRQCCFMWQ